MDIENQSELKTYLKEGGPELKQILEDLILVGHCSRCCLRLILVDDDNAYLKDEKAIEDEILNYIKKEVKFTDNCISCLGLLKEDTINNFSLEVYNKVKSEAYEHPSFQINMALPQGSLVSERLSNVYLREKINDFIKEDSIPSLKTRLRLLLGSYIEKKHELKYHLEGELQITLTIEHVNSESLAKILDQPKEIHGYKAKWPKTINSRAKIIENLRVLTDSSAKQLFEIPIKPYAEYPVLKEIKISSESIFIAGRYNKLIRHVSQSPWVINGVKKTEHSVSELIGEPLKQLFNSTDYNFVAAGREDADVRMLGTGRPFSMELINPRKFINQNELDNITQSVNSTNIVSVNTLVPIDKKELNLIKEGEQSKVKYYQCLVWASDINNKSQCDELIKNIPPTPFIVNQNTPLRVLHRRSPLTRPKTIYDIACRYVDKNFIVLQIKAEAGTYIKELIHGDMGRTELNIKEIMKQKQMDLIELDVIHIDLVWPTVK